MLSIRRAERTDASLISDLIHELADFERASPDVVHSTMESVLRDGFGSTPKFHALIADLDGQPVGMALFYYFYSTWQARSGIFLEDLFVRPEHRGRGIGQVLLERLAKTAVTENCFCVRWEVLDWNEKAIGFYESIGAHFRPEWKVMQLDGKSLETLSQAKKQRN